MTPSIKRLLGLDRPGRLLIGIAVAILVRVAFPTYIIDTHSMEPTICAGDFAIASRLSYWVKDPARGDVAIMQPVKEISSLDWCHRIIGVAGDDNYKLADGRSTVARKDIFLDESVRGSQMIPAGYYYQSGDSSESYHGLVPRNLIKARVVFCVKLPFRK